MTTVNDIADILRIIREQPEWAEALRGALLSKEVLELPQRLADFTATAEKRFAALESDVAELKEDVREIKGDIVNIKGNIVNIRGELSKRGRDIGNLLGADYERKVGNNISSIASQHLGLQKIRILKGYKAFDEMPFFDLIDDAVDRGTIDRQQRIDADNVDIVLQGRSQPEKSLVYVALEVSVTVGASDIQRAAGRAQILGLATGAPTIPVVIGSNVDEARQEFADQQGVTLIAVAQ